MMLDLPKSRLRRIALLGLSAWFLLNGVNHFVITDVYVSTMPTYLVAPLALVYISGIFEILGGLGVLHPRTRRLAGWGLIALLIAVFPANIEMARRAEEFAEIASPTILFARLPFQIVFIAWVYFAALRKPVKAAP